MEDEQVMVLGCGHVLIMVLVLGCGQYALVTVTHLRTSTVPVVLALGILKP